MNGTACYLHGFNPKCCFTICDPELHGIFAEIQSPTKHVHTSSGSERRVCACECVYICVYTYIQAYTYIYNKIKNKALKTHICVYV